MRKKIITICMIILILSMSVMLFACDKKEYSLEKSTRIIDYKDEIYSNLQTISTIYPDRYDQSDSSQLFVEYLKTYMDGLGYEIFEQVFYLSSADSNTCNIICKKESSSDKQIIIGCQWDNCYGSFNDSNPDGAYESGAAIATLMAIAKELKNKDLPFDLKIVFFGGGVRGYYGSEYFIGKMTQEEKEKTSLVINLSMLGGGDNTYMYSRDFDTNYNDTMYQIAEVNELNFEKVPLDKRIINSKFSDSLKYDYVHIGMFGNQNVFMNEGIATVNYLSINWKDKSNPSFTEISGQTNIFETVGDTFENMISRVGEDKLKERLNNVLKSVVLSIDDYYGTLEQDLSDPTEIDSFIYGNEAYYIGVVVVKILCVGIIFIILTALRPKINKAKEKGNEKIRQEIIKAMDQMDQEDIGFEDPFSEEKESNDIDEDIFQ